MTTITKLLEEYRNGSADACEEILKRMMPLAKKYAGKIHCMDYEDALQELCLTILEALTHLDPACPEGKCVSYIETSVINRYYALCKRYLSAPETENICFCQYKSKKNLLLIRKKHHCFHPVMLLRTILFRLCFFFFVENVIHLPAYLHTTWFINKDFLNNL